MISRCTASAPPGEPSVLSVGIILGLVLGLLAGGSLINLSSVRLRWVSLIATAVIVRFGTEAALLAGVPLIDTLRLPLLAASFGILLVGLWGNRSLPGPDARLRRDHVERDRHRRQRRLHADLGAEPHRGRPHPGGRLHGHPHALRPGAGAVPPPPRAARRHHPDPVPDHPERRLDRRRLPGRGAGPVPVREHRPRPQRPRRRGGGADRLPARGDQRGTEIGPVAGVRRIRRARAPDRHGQPPWRPPGLAGPLHDPGRAARGRRAAPAPPVRPPRPQRVVLGALGRTADLAVRRPDPPVRPGRAGAGDDRLDRRRRPVLLLRRPSEPVPLAPSPARSWTAGTARRC